MMTANAASTAASTITITTPVSFLPATNQTRVQPTLDVISGGTIFDSSAIDALNNNYDIDQNTNLTQNVSKKEATIISDNHHKTTRRRSLLNFKSFDFHLKTLYTGLRHPSQIQLATETSVRIDEMLNGQQTQVEGGRSRPYQSYTRLPPYLKIESPNNEEIENLLIDYSQSPYSTRRNSTHDDHPSYTQLIHQQEERRYLQQSHRSHPVRPISHSPTTSTGGFLLSPCITELKEQRMRRSSTSDLVNEEKRSSRPSTTELLRKARERQGAGIIRIGRSASHTGLPRGGLCGSFGYRPGNIMGGRRTSMAF